MYMYTDTQTQTHTHTHLDCQAHSWLRTFALLGFSTLTVFPETLLKLALLLHASFQMLSLATLYKTPPCLTPDLVSLYALLLAITMPLFAFLFLFLHERCFCIGPLDKNEEWCVILSQFCFLLFSSPFKYFLLLEGKTGGIS